MIRYFFSDSYSKSVSVKTKRGFVVVNFDCKVMDREVVVASTSVEVRKSFVVDGTQNIYAQLNYLTYNELNSNAKYWVQKFA